MATNPSTTLDDIVAVVRQLGGVATLNQICEALDPLPLPPAAIRRVIQNHSSDSPDYGRNFTDIFYVVVGSGGGTWGLRDMAPPPPVVHYALDLESPPVIACDANEPGIISSPTASEVTCPDCLRTEHFPRSAQQITAHRVLMAASALIRDGIGPEYDRAIVDLTCDLIGIGPDNTIVMNRILRSLAEGK